MLLMHAPLYFQRTQPKEDVQMTFIKPLLVSFSLLAFAGAAIAADDAKN